MVGHQECREIWIARLSTPNSRRRNPYSTPLTPNSSRNFEWFIFLIHDVLPDRNSHLSQPKILNFSILRPHRAKIRCQSFWKSNSTYYERLTQFGPIQTILGRFCITLIQYQDIVVNFTSKEWTQGPPGGNLFALWWPPARIRSMRCAASALLLGVRKWSNILTKYILAILLLWWSSPWLAINQKFLVRCTKID